MHMVRPIILAVFPKMKHMAQASLLSHGLVLTDFIHILQGCLINTGAIMALP